MHRVLRGLRPTGVALALWLAACGTAPEPGATGDDATPSAPRPAAARPPGGALQLRIADGMITLRADDVSLGAILRELERQGGLRLVSRDDLRERVSLTIERQPLPAVLRQLLPARDFLLLQGPADSMLFIHTASSPALSAVPTTVPVHAEVGGDLEAIAAQPRAAGSEAVRSLGTSATLSDVPEIREEAVAALGDIGGVEARAAIATALSDPSPQVRSIAIRTLGRVGGNGAVPALAWAMTQGAGPERQIAVDAIGRIGGTQAASVLQAALRHNDPLVRQAAAEWLDEYRAASPATARPAILRP